MHGWEDGYMDGWWMVGYTGECMCEWMDTWMNTWVGG